jgi:hypothetical protein
MGVTRHFSQLCQRLLLAASCASSRGLQILGDSGVAQLGGKSSTSTILSLCGVDGLAPGKPLSNRLPQGRSSRLASYSHFPYLQQIRRDVFLIFVLLDPGLQLNGMLILSRGKSKRLDDFLKGAGSGIDLKLRIRSAPVRISAVLCHVVFWMRIRSAEDELLLCQGIYRVSVVQYREIAAELLKTNVAQPCPAGSFISPASQDR